MGVFMRSISIYTRNGALLRVRLERLKKCLPIFRILFFRFDIKALCYLLNSLNCYL